MQRPNPYGGYSAGPPPRPGGPPGASPQQASYGSSQSPVPPYGGASGAGYGPGAPYQGGPSGGPSGYGPSAGGPPPHGYPGGGGGGGFQGAPPRPYGQPGGPGPGGPQRPPYGQFGPPQFGDRSGSYGSEDDGGGRKRMRMEDGPGPAPGSGGYDQSHEQFLQERLKRERPCRTLFLRNIDFKANVPELRSQFESFGEINTFFDLVEKRGISFISYFDLRAAEAAKNAMQGLLINGRQLDVHYSLPREHELTKRCERDKDQGTLFVVLKKAPHDLSDDELVRLFSQYGEVKNLRRYKDQGNCRFLEFWDCRACKDAHDNLIGSEYRGGTWDAKFAWDAGASDRAADLPREEREREWARVGQAAGGGRGSIRPPANNMGRPNNFGRPPFPNDGARPPNNFGPPPPGAGGYGPNRPPAPYGAPPPMQSAGMKRPYDDGGDYSGGYSSGGQGYGGYGGPGAQNNQGGPGGYGRPPPPSGAPPYGSPSAGWRPPAGAGVQSPPPNVAAPAGGGAAGNGNTDADRLNNAQRVQQMLAALKGGGSGATGSPAGGAPANPAASASRSPPSAQSQPAKPANDGSGSAASAPGLPSSIAALLQMAQKQSAQQQQK